MTGALLRDHNFVNLYLGAEYAEMTEAPGSFAERVHAPAELGGDIAQLRVRCMEMWDNDKHPDFSLRQDGILYRVNAVVDLNGSAVFVLRRVQPNVLAFHRLTLPEGIRQKLLNPHKRGLVIVSGDQGSGKTTTVASTMVARCKTFGGFHVAVEDPTETELEGVHGSGRIIQIPATPENGSYEEQLRRMMRMTPATLMIGEIRCKDSAMEAVRQSGNGTTVLSTTHGSSPYEAIARVCSFAQVHLANARELLSLSLSAILHQTMERDCSSIRVVYTSLDVDGVDEASIRTKIREGRFDALAQDIDNQAKRNTFQ